MTLHRVSFPSTNFPGADLRVTEKTTYSCICEHCSQHLEAPFSWLLQSVNKAEAVSAEELKAIRDVVGRDGAVGSYQRINCPSCHASYLIHLQADETSMGAMRAVVLGIIEIASDSVGH